MIVDVLSFEKFVGEKINNIAIDNVDEATGQGRTIYHPILRVITELITEMTVKSDITEIIKFANRSSDAEKARIYDLIPTIVKRIDWNDYGNMKKIFESTL